MENEDIRKSIIESAGKIFSRYGYKKATLDDIASGIGKTKSYIYYYFKSKEEIFEAVVAYEAQSLRKELLESIREIDDPKLKLKTYLLARISYFDKKVNYYEALRADYLSNLKFVDMMRGKYDREEFAMIRDLLEYGVDKGSFRVDNTELAAFAVLTALKSLEIPLLMNEYGDDLNIRLEYLIQVLFYGIVKR